MKTYLIGYRATGKSTVGRILALELDAPFADSDDEIEQREGRTIAEIFAAEGEPYFRDLETAAVSRLAEGEAGVVSLGGGAIVREENRRALSGGVIIWLKASSDEIASRLASDASTRHRRPRLTTHTVESDEIRQLLTERDPLYAACADLAIDTDSKTPAEVATEALAGLLKQRR